LADSAYEGIRSRIFNGTYPPGAKLSTQEISDSLGMSRTPVIAAINRLVAQGIATEIPRRGVIVAKLAPNQIRDFIDMRKMMEVYAVRPAIQNASFFPKVVDEMESWAIELKSLPDTAYDQITVYENRFHSAYIKLANNGQLLKLYESNWGIGVAVYTYIIAKVPVQQYLQSCDEHMRFVECLRTGNESALKELVESHLNCVYKTLHWITNLDEGFKDW